MFLNFALLRRLRYRGPDTYLVLYLQRILSIRLLYRRQPCTKASSTTRANICAATIISYPSRETEPSSSCWSSCADILHHINLIFVVFCSIDRSCYPQRVVLHSMASPVTGAVRLYLPSAYRANCKCYNLAQSLRILVTDLICLCLLTLPNAAWQLRWRRVILTRRSEHGDRLLASERTRQKFMDLAMGRYNRRNSGRYRGSTKGIEDATMCLMLCSGLLLMMLTWISE